MHTYRLEIHRNGKLLGHFESSAPWAKEAVADVAACFLPDQGYCVTPLKASGERRLLEVGPQGIRVLGSELCFSQSPDH